AGRAAGGHRGRRRHGRGRAGRLRDQGRGTGGARRRRRRPGAPARPAGLGPRGRGPAAPASQTARRRCLMSDVTTSLDPRAAAVFTARTLAIAACYFAAGRLGLLRELVIQDSVVSPVWPPTGVATAALLIYGLGAWPGISLGAFAVILSLTTSPEPSALGLVAGSTAARARRGLPPPPPPHPPRRLRPPRPPPGAPRRPPRPARRPRGWPAATARRPSWGRGWGRLRLCAICVPLP